MRKTVADPASWDPALSPTPFHCAQCYEDSARGPDSTHLPALMYRLYSFTWCSSKPTFSAPVLGQGPDTSLKSLAALDTSLIAPVSCGCPAKPQPSTDQASACCQHKFASVA